jgi:hypothetical protein
LDWPKTPLCTCPLCILGRMTSEGRAFIFRNTRAHRRGDRDGAVRYLRNAITQERIAHQ